MASDNKKVPKKNQNKNQSQNQSPRQSPDQDDRNVQGAYSDKSRNNDMGRRDENIAEAGQGDEGIDDEERSAKSVVDPYVDTSDIDSDDDDASTADTQRIPHVDDSGRGTAR
jgi:hypothetical protein